MNVTPTNATVNAAFFQPIVGLASRSSHARTCPDFSDDDYLQCGLLRVLESSTSDRAFLQEHGARLNNSPTQANYFATLHSQRRGAVAADVNNALRIMANQTLPDRLAGIAELASYAVFAMDGHWHKTATHHPRHQGVKMAVGHFYSLNLRTHTLRQLAVGEGAHEHDLSVLKRLTQVCLDALQMKMITQGFDIDWNQLSRAKSLRWTIENSHCCSLCNSQQLTRQQSG